MSEDWYARYRRRTERRYLMQHWGFMVGVNNFAVLAQISHRTALKAMLRRHVP